MRNPLKIKVFLKKEWKIEIPEVNLFTTSFPPSFLFTNKFNFHFQQFRLISGISSWNCHSTIHILLHHCHSTIHILIHHCHSTIHILIHHCHSTIHILIHHCDLKVSSSQAKINKNFANYFWKPKVNTSALKC